MLLSMMGHFSVSKHFSVSHNQRVSEGLHGLLVLAVALHDEEYPSETYRFCTILSEVSNK